MRLIFSNRIWEKLARKDPYWAVLTDPEKSDNRWQVDEFFRTGVEEVAANLSAIEEQCPGFVRGKVLDFGCGVGRLSQALATHFEEVVGLDVAAGMIKIADRHNRFPGKVRYLRNARTDLGPLADASFDLVYSLITLQHVPERLIPGYIREFVRVCRPGGVIYFQLPTFLPVESSGKTLLSFYPPTIWKRVVRRCRKIIELRANMSMAAIPAAEVGAILNRAGAEVIAVLDHPARDIRSAYYVARRRA